jgi:hypothetical protein
MIMGIFASASVAEIAIELTGIFRTKVNCWGKMNDADLFDWFGNENQLLFSTYLIEEHCLSQIIINLPPILIKCHNNLSKHITFKIKEYDLR